jgi:protein-S-isoprenylcysteine O-methyltransferase Ste14
MNVYGIIQLTSLAVFAFMLLGRTIKLRAQGRRTFSLGRGKTGFKQAVELFFVFLFTLWSMETAFHSFGMTSNILPYYFYLKVLDAEFLKITGACLAVISVILLSVAMKELGGSWRMGVDETTPGMLVRSGLYRFSRNPVYVSYILYLLGIFMINGEVFFLASLVLAVFALHFQILQEEQSLKRNMGKEYEEYITKVRRYF